MLPPEVVALVLGNFSERDRPHLRSARLVCRQWNMLAHAQLFREMALESTRTIREWNLALNDERSRTAIRRAVICSAPNMTYNHWGEELGYEEEPEVDAAVRRVAELSHIDSLELEFPRGCVAAHQVLDRSGAREYVQQLRSTERRTMHQIAEAFERRPAGSRPLRCLQIKNLQNTPNGGLSSTGLLYNCARSITSLNILVAVHDFDVRPDDRGWDIVERRMFQPYLLQNWLVPVSEQLTSLSLAFQECWGPAPYCLDARHLRFPRLEKLALAKYVIGHHDQMDWVLAQKSLRYLYLDTCSVVSHLAVTRHDLDQWNLPTHDWLQLPEHSFAFGRDEEESIFTFDGTWEILYDRIRECLPHLRDFSFGCEPLGDEARHRGLSLHNQRYVNFVSADRANPWHHANSDDGEMVFGDNDPTPSAMTIEDFEQRQTAKLSLNRHRETEAGDGRGLADLMTSLRKT